MKVVRRLTENVQLATSYRPGESALKGNVDILRLFGNKHLIHGAKIEDEHSSEIERFVKGPKRSNQRDSRTGENASTADRFTPRHIPPSSIAQEDNCSDCSLTTGDGDLHDDIDCDDDELCDLSNVGNADQAHGDEDNSIFGQRYPSSHGPKMETIHEEAEDVDIEMDDFRGKYNSIVKIS